MLSPSGSETSFVFLENSPKPTPSASYAQLDPQVPDKVRVYLAPYSVYVRWLTFPSDPPLSAAIIYTRLNSFIRT